MTKQQCLGEKWNEWIGRDEPCDKTARHFIAAHRERPLEPAPDSPEPTVDGWSGVVLTYCEQCLFRKTYKANPGNTDPFILDLTRHAISVANITHDGIRIEIQRYGRFRKQGLIVTIHTGDQESKPLKRWFDSMLERMIPDPEMESAVVVDRQLQLDD